jgi:predicted transposase/invertase (TIGR01784 family)
LIDEVRKNQQNGMTRDKAITVAIDTCIGLNILTEFLTDHYSEVKKMLNWEYDADAERRVIREEGVQQGMQQGMQQGQLKERIDMAKKLKASALLSNTQIAEISGLSIAEIEKI